MRDEEVGISIKDVLVYCFLHWRSAIAVVVAGAVLGGAYYGMKARSAHTSAAAVEVTQTEEVSAVSQLALEAQQANVEKLAEYFESSLLMRIDPTNEYVARADLLIGAGSLAAAQKLDAVALAYTSGLMSSAALEELSEEIGTTPAYLRELVTVSTSSNDSIAALAGSSLAEGAGTTVVQDSSGESSAFRVVTLSLRVIAPNARMASSIRDALLDAAAELQEDVTASVAPHTLSVASQIDYTSIDASLLQTQADRANAVYSAQANLENNLSNAPKPAEEAASAPSGTSLAKSLAKGALLGGVAAFLLYGFLLCLRYVYSATPETRGQVEARYALPELGSYTYGKDAFYKGQADFDRWLRRLAGMEEPHDAEAVADMVAANVRLYAGEASSLLVTSSARSERAAELAERLGASLEGVTVALANDLASSAEARGQLRAADAVVFVEEYGKSGFEAIDDEITLAVETGRAPLGLVMA